MGRCLRREQVVGAPTHPAHAAARVRRSAEQRVPRADAAAAPEKLKARQAAAAAAAAAAAVPGSQSESHNQPEPPAAGREHGDGGLEHSEKVHAAQ